MTNATPRPPKSRSHFLVGGIAIIVGLAILMTLVWVISPYNDPEYNMVYSDARYDCRRSVPHEKCAVIVTVTNPYDHAVTVDYGEISGPADWGGSQRIKFHGSDGRTTDAQIYYVTFPAHSTSLLRIHHQVDVVNMTAISIDGNKLELRKSQLSDEEIDLADIPLGQSQLH